MDKVIKSGGWPTSLLIFAMPIFLILFLGSILAYFQVRSEFDAYLRIEEYSSLRELKGVAANELVMLNGRIAQDVAAPQTDGLVVFQERPLEGREVRYGEQFPLVFPTFTLELPDGSIMVLPSTDRGQVIAHEARRVTDEDWDREYTGFAAGDVVTVQGEWWPATGDEPAVLGEVTGITGTDRAGVIEDWYTAFRRLDVIRLTLGLLTLVSLVLLVWRLRRDKIGRSNVNRVDATLGVDGADG